MGAYGVISKILWHLSTVGLIGVLHLPLIFLAIALHDDLGPGQNLTDLSPLSLISLFAGLALPYALLAILGIPWNPQRARLNEYDA